MRIIAAILAMFMLLALPACNNMPAASGDKLVAYASVYPMYDFLREIGGEHVDARSIMPAGVEPHDWEPSTQDIINLENAELFVYNGAGLEHWVDRVVSTLKNQTLVVVNTSEKVRLLVEDEDGHEDEETHDDHDHEHRDHEHDHDHHNHHDHGGVDPHIWLSIDNARAQTAAIAEALIMLDSDNADYYTERLEAYHAELIAIDTEYRTALADVSRRSIVVVHKAYGYLCYSYDLEQVSVLGFSPDSGDPAPPAMVEVEKFCRENDVKVIFFEGSDPRIANAIASAVGATTDILTPIESLTQEDIENGENYLSLMRRNLAALVRALS